MAPLQIVTVDAFTDTPFTGNPAAVCVLPRGKTDEGWMQKVAMEMNFSETAFLRGREAGSYDLRWFTPTVEVDLCGHATLASAHVLWEEGRAGPRERLRFHTRSGVLTAERTIEKKRAWIGLDFPAMPERPYEGSIEVLAKALGTRPTHVGTYGQDYLAEVESERVLRALSPDLELLKTLPARGVCVTSAPSDSTRGKGFDFVSRFFAPKQGIDEDPVTGSAHCGLGPFWGRRLAKEEVHGYQASARGGSVRVRIRGDRVVLVGQAVTVMRASLA
jgi:PhzF family phenazine biosynthesis protein